MTPITNLKGNAMLKANPKAPAIAHTHYQIGTYQNGFRLFLFTRAGRNLTNQYIAAVCEDIKPLQMIADVLKLEYTGWPHAHC
jgi:hypothetical protein